MTRVNRQLAVVAAVISIVAVLLPMRSQTFTNAAIDGTALRMLIAGAGDTTVVFENGAGPPLEMWGRVQPAVSGFARTVAYDRAGVGLSPDGPLPRDGERITRELHDALRAAGVAPPYVLVGASFGGLYIRIFAGMYPQDVSGMVLVDPTHDGDNVARSTYPELAAVRETVEQARASQVPPRIPLVLIDALSLGEVPFATGEVRRLRAAARPSIEADTRTYQAWLETIPGARLVVTERSGHNVPIEQPQLVIDTIREVVNSVSGRRPAE